MLRADFAESITTMMYKSYYEGQQYDDYVPVHPQIFAQEKSDKAYEKSTSIIGQGELAETTEGQDAPLRPAKEGWSTLGKNRSFKERYEITRENQDDLKQVRDVLKKLAYGWGMSWGQTKDALAVKFFNYGGIAAGNDVFNNAIPNVVADSTGNLIYDSKALFVISGDDRTTKANNTYYNHVGALALNVANFKTAYSLMTETNAYNEDGMNISLIPDTLLIPPALKFTAAQMINSTLLPGSTTNDINPLKGIVKIVEWPKLTDTDGWFLGKAKAAKGLIFQNRMDLEIKFFESQLNGSWVATCMARAGVRVDNWRYWVASNVSTT